MRISRKAMERLLLEVSGSKPRKTKYGVTVYGTAAFRGVPVALWSWNGRPSERKASVISGFAPYRFRVNRVWISLADVPEAKPGRKRSRIEP